MAKNLNPHVSPVLAGKAAVYQDGKLRDDAVKFTAKASVTTKESKVLSQIGTTTRTTGISYSGQITFLKASPWLVNYIKTIKEYGEAKPFMLQFVISDTGSDFYKKYKSQTVTLVDCLLTGDIPLIEADAEGDTISETIDFTARDMLA